MLPQWFACIQVVMVPTVTVIALTLFIASHRLMDNLGQLCPVWVSGFWSKSSNCFVVFFDYVIV